MKICQECKKPNKTRRTKYCSAVCMMEATAKRSYSRYTEKPKKDRAIFGTEFFDWRDYPNTIII